MNVSSPPASFEEMLCGVKNLLEEVPRFRQMPLGELFDHVCWHWNHGTIAWAVEPEGEKYTGVCLIKVIDDIRDMDTPYVHCPSGRYIFVEEVVSKIPDAWQQMFNQLHDIWGDKECVIWDRRERTEKSCPRIYTWKDYLKILRRLTRERWR